MYKFLHILRQSVKQTNKDILVTYGNIEIFLKVENLPQNERFWSNFEKIDKKCTNLSIN